MNELTKEATTMTEQPNGDHETQSEAHAEGDETSSSRSYGRRALMLGAATAGVGAAASLVAGSEPAGADTPDSGAKKVVLSKANTATGTTSVSMAVDGDSGIEGIDTSSAGGYGVYGTSENGTGIYGTITGDTSGHFAVQGSDQSTGEGGGAGVGGASTNGTGIYGISTNATGVYGIHSSGPGTGVAGIDNSGVTGSNGVLGSSSSGNGVSGESSTGFGVYGNSTGVEAIGIYGNAPAANGNGVYGAAVGEGGLGVAGVATAENAYGVYGYAQGTGASYGVYAYSKNSDALSVSGNAAVSGSLSKGGGSFKIDHPVEPEDKYLLHSFVESPDMMNVYNGNVVLDDNGKATVELPEWFEALNRDFRYQLTAIGAPTVVYISDEIVDGAFSIAGGNAHQKVSWQVTGIRQDAWANANRIPVEVDKKAEDRGRYLHPELFGGEEITSLANAVAVIFRHSDTSLMGRPNVENVDPNTNARTPSGLPLFDAPALRHLSQMQ
jgi:trimeric autotransporter adhesin